MTRAMSTTPPAGRHSDQDPEYEARTVRPYAVTGGRVRAAGNDLPLEALVDAPFAWQPGWEFVL